jgi:CheY-like chemotaxis protein
MEPIPRQETAGRQESAQASSLVVGNDAPDSQPPSRGKAILVVDDEPQVAEVLVEIFSQDECTVETAADGEEALAKLRHRSYDVIVCDIRMPRLNGGAFYRAIEERAPQLLWRVLFVTGDILSQETREFLQQTAAPVMEKPFSLGDIRKIVRHILGASEGR